MIFLQQFIYAALSSVVFGIFFNAPKSSLKESAMIGGFSWIISYEADILTGNIIFATFLGCIFVGGLSEIFATEKKRPATVYLIPSIIPFVPGAGTYYTLLEFLDKNYMQAFEKGIETVGIAFAISFGLIFASFLSAPIRRIRLGRAKKSL